MKKLILVILIILFVIAFVVVLYNKNNPRVTFEAIIEDIIEYNGNYTFLVKGIESNDINHTGEYTFMIKDTIKLKQGENDLEISDFEEGQKIRIIYDGIVMTSYPAQIANVFEVELLEK